MRPSVVTWTASNLAYIASPQTCVAGFPATLLNTVVNTNKYTGVTTRYLTLPKNNNRIISITTTLGDLSGVSFTIVGSDVNGNPLSEVLAGAASGTVYSVNAYNVIRSITPNVSDSSTFEIGIAGGNTSFYKADIWNKNQNYTIAYSDVTGTVSLTPAYKIKSIETFINGVQTINTDTTDIYTIPIANTSNVVVSPSSITTIPVTANCAISIVHMPLSGLITQVSNTTTGTFTQTIIQQGASY